LAFTCKGKPVRSIKYALAKALGRAGIKDFRHHDLRHTYVSNARFLASGEGAFFIEQIKHFNISLE
jgi:integrase